MAEASKGGPRWMRLDNAALIFPAAQRRHWSNAFRIAFTFTDQIEKTVMPILASPFYLLALPMQPR